jgi:hypothetical protein
MEQTVYKPQKGRLETLYIDFTDENTTWFDDCEDSHGIFSITDLQGGILIKEADYTHPLYVYDISRADIGYDHRRARALHRQYIDWILRVSPGIENEKEDLYHFIWGPAPKPPGFNALETKV